jgi:hypothetical protein
MSMIFGHGDFLCRKSPPVAWAHQVLENPGFRFVAQHINDAKDGIVAGLTDKSAHAKERAEFHGQHHVAAQLQFSRCESRHR